VNRSLTAQEFQIGHFCIFYFCILAKFGTKKNRNFVRKKEMQRTLHSISSEILCSKMFVPVLIAFLGTLTFSGLPIGQAEFIDLDIETPPLFNVQNEINELLNQQVAIELYASHSYLAMAAFFGREDVNKHGFRKLFMDSAKEEYEHAQKFIDYLNSRNGRLHSLTVEPVVMFDYGLPGEAGLKALEVALGLEIKVTNKIKHLHEVASGSRKKHLLDSHLTDFLESTWITEQVEAIRKLKGQIHTLKNMGEPRLAEFLFDKELLKNE
jgi:ferritin heavy chain